MAHPHGRYFLGKSYGELQQITGIDPAHWSRWMNGKLFPTISTVEELAPKFDMSVKDLMLEFLAVREQAKNKQV